jgi:hypothetical protein
VIGKPFGRRPRAEPSLIEAANAALYERQCVSDPPATMATVAEFPIRCPILLSLIDAILAASPCGRTAHRFWVVWQRIFCAGAVCGGPSGFS